MKQKSRYLKQLISICGCIVFCLAILSACSFGVDTDKHIATVALVKNTTMSTYGTGFAVGTPGKEVNTLITAYSVIATPNGSVPKTAEVKISESEKTIWADVIFYDTVRNVAVLRLSKPSKELKHMLLRLQPNEEEIIHITGYDGTGNAMSDFESFNVTNTVQYTGTVSPGEEAEFSVYTYSNEFNRAVVGGPAMDGKGNVIGMCVYSHNENSAYSQYILSAEELIRVLSLQNAEFMTSEEFVCKAIIISAILIGAVLFIFILTVALIVGHKIEKNLKKDRYIKITGGMLEGDIYAFRESLTIGKNPDTCDVVYPPSEPGIDDEHCSIRLIGRHYYLVDAFSESGTYLENGIRLSSSYPYKIKNKKFAFYIKDPENRFEFISEKEL